MANQMKKRPMQKQAERLAAQGRYGDSMLVHMNPVEVEGIAALMPGGKLTTNPKTGQPEAFWPIVAAAIGAVKGGIDARNQKKDAKKRTAAIESRQIPFDEYTARQLGQIRGHSAFDLPKTLADYDDPSKATFLPSGTSTGINVDYQRAPGAMYANVPPSANPFEMGPLPKRITQPPVTSDPIVDGSGGTGSAGSSDVSGLGPDIDQLVAINASRRELGLPEFETMQDLYDEIADITERGPGIAPGLPMLANKGGAASLNEAGESPGMMNKVLGGIGNILGGAGSGNNELESMTREELIEYIKSLSRDGSSPRTMDVVGRDSGGKPGYAPTAGGGLSDHAGMFSKENVAQLLGKADGGLMASPVYMAQGGEGFANLGAHIASSMPAFSGARQLGLQMQGKLKGDLGQMDTAGGPGYNTVGTEEYESRQRPVKAAARRKARRERRAIRRQERADRSQSKASSTAETPNESKTQSFPRLRGMADKIEKARQRLANKQEATDAANAYARSMGVPEAQRGGFPARIRASDERINQVIRNRAPFIGRGIDFLEGRGGNQGEGNTGRILRGILSLSGYADGDMVEKFPRMNGPISGPGTETSDDIPAMLSDGEFVVNAKAVRGIGRLNGANKTKEEQRREGARMMYALQQAGEEASRRS
tara:strand:- start:256 stop:2214 length:1959 start_codon:yes stop_codon:yes gene_type:complete